MTSLITGGSGFIGAQVVRRLLARGEERPVIFSRNPTTKQFDDLARNAEAIAGDLGNFDDVCKAIAFS